MAGKLKMVSLVMAVMAALIHSSTAATYVVGDGLGWTIPATDPSAYTTWASNKTFTVGDILVFNFATGAHDAAEVTRAAYDGCNGNNPISLHSNGPSNITLTSPGQHYFICTVSGHCSIGQKLSITVTASPSSSPSPQPTTIPSPTPAPAAVVPTPAAPQPNTPAPLAPEPNTPAPSFAPQPNTPAPSFAPAPAPSRGPVTYTVGDLMGWTIPANGGAAAYQNWARGKTFVVGDILVFNYANSTHDVAEVTSQNYASCNGTSPISIATNPPARITLTTAGEHSFICTFPRHCDLGQKLAINVTSTATMPASPTSSPPSIATSPSSNVPSSPSPTSAPPPPNSATSLGVAGLSVTFLSIAVALMY